MRNREELMVAPTTLNVRAKLGSYNEGYTMAKQVVSENPERFEDLAYVADNSTIASPAFYAGMIAALFPVTTVYVLGE